MNRKLLIIAGVVVVLTALTGATPQETKRITEGGEFLQRASGDRSGHTGGDGGLIELLSKSRACTAGKEQ
jgi:hypothetical protein